MDSTSTDEFGTPFDRTEFPMNTPTDEEVAKIVDLAPAPEPPKPPTRKEWGKIMRLFFTVERGTIRTCGHKLGVVDHRNGKVLINEEPKTNCPDCWFSFFNENADLVSTADQCFSQEGKETLTRIRGAKFTKNFGRFMSTMARFKAELDAQADAARKEITNGSSEVNEPDGPNNDRNSETGGIFRPDSEAVNNEGEVGSSGLGERSDQQAVQD